jgi:hypothetical protein
MKLSRLFGPGAIVFLAIWLILLAGGRSNFLRDPGTFWHIKTGELILSDGFIDTEPYTFTFAGTWWIPYQWLGEVVMALVHRVGGFDALLLGAVTIIASVFAWLAMRLLNTGLHPIAVGTIVLIGLAASSSHFHVRPHLFTIAGMAITMSVLVDVEAGRLRVSCLWWLVPLFVIWTNIHGGVLGGMATVAIAAGGWFTLWLFGGTARLNLAWIVAAACCATALVNPYGLDLVKTWQIIMAEPVLKEIIQEHSALDPAEPYAWPVFLLAAIYSFLLAGGPWRELRVTWLLPIVWFVLTLDRIRHAPIFAVVTLIATASIWPQTRWAAWLMAHRPDFYQPVGIVRTPRWATLVLPAAAVCLVLGLQIGRVEAPVIGANWARHDPAHWPVELLDVIKEQEPQSLKGRRLFNDYIDGGFIIYHAPGYKVFVDDRCEVFGGPWLLEFVRAGSENTAVSIARWEKQYGRFDFALTRSGTGFDEYYARSEEWVCLKRTTTAAFYKRSIK